MVQISTTDICDYDIQHAFAMGMIVPQNTPCPNQCRFCYENRISRLLPRIKTRYIRPYNESSFTSCIRTASRLFKNNRFSNLKFKGTFPAVEIKNGFYYMPHCDFFSLGLTPGQIELLIKNDGVKSPIYTTGLNVDIQLIRYLTRKYPDKFRVHLSVITFDPAIRARLMNSHIELASLKKVCGVLLRPTFFLLYFSKKQVISDVAYLNQFTVKNRGTIYLHKLYYNRLTPDYIKRYSEHAKKEFKDIVYYFRDNNESLRDIASRLQFSPEQEIYAWSWKAKLKALLRVCDDASDEVIFCSAGAHRVIKELFKKAHVISIESLFGGCMDFTLGITVQAILLKIKELIADGIVPKRIYLPHSMFCINSTYDLNLDRLDRIKAEYPNTKVIIIRIPRGVLKSVLSLEQCVNFYSKSR